jgi:hypothetical protein
VPAVTNAVTITWLRVRGSRARAVMARRRNGVAASAELSTMISVICMVNGSSIHNPW